MNTSGPPAFPTPVALFRRLNEPARASGVMRTGAAPNSTTHRNGIVVKMVPKVTHAVTIVAPYTPTAWQRGRTRNDRVTHPAVVAGPDHPVSGTTT